MAAGKFPNVGGRCSDMLYLFIYGNVRRGRTDRTRQKKEDAACFGVPPPCMGGGKKIETVTRLFLCSVDRHTISDGHR